MTNEKLSTMFHRANGLALSGAYNDCAGVVQHLQDEGYAEASDVFGESSLRVQIDRTCKKAFNV